MEENAFWSIVFQLRMHELIEGMSNVQVIAVFLKLCRYRRLKLNTEKIRLRQKGVSFIGHVATDTGLRVDPAKVKAIVEMPAPTDKIGV